MLWKPTCGRSSLGGKMTTLCATAFVSLLISTCQALLPSRAACDRFQGKCPLSSESLAPVASPGVIWPVAGVFLSCSVAGENDFIADWVSSWTILLLLSDTIPAATGGVEFGGKKNHTNPKIQKDNWNKYPNFYFFILYCICWHSACS